MSTHTPKPWRAVKTGDNPPSWCVMADAIEDEDATLCHDIYSEADALLVAESPVMREQIEAQASALEIYGLQVRAMAALLTKTSRRLDQACEQRDALLAACEAVLLFHAGGWMPEDRQRWETLTGGADATTRGLCDFLRAAVAEAKP